MNTIDPWSLLIVIFAGWVIAISRGTIANILKVHGITPAFERSKRTPWRAFPADFFIGPLESAR